MKKPQSGEQIIIDAELPKASPSKPRAAQTAYQFFIQDKKGGAQKYTLTEFGAMWREMSQDYKQKYIELAEKDKLRYQAEMANHLVTDSKFSYKGHFPITRLKTIISKDDDKRPFTKDAYLYLERAIELFGQQILKSVNHNMQQDNRKMVLEDDFNNLVLEADEYDFLQCIATQSKPKKDRKSQKSKDKNPFLDRPSDQKQLQFQEAQLDQNVEVDLCVNQSAEKEIEQESEKQVQTPDNISIEKPKGILKYFQKNK